MSNDLPKDNSAVNYLWFDAPQYGSGLDCRYGSLGDDSGAFGVLVSDEAGAQKSGYSLTNFQSALAKATPETLERLGLSGIEKTGITGELEKSLLEAIRKQ